MAEVVLKNIEKVYPNAGSKKHNLKVTEEGVLAVENFNLTIADHD